MKYRIFVFGLVVSLVGLSLYEYSIRENTVPVESISQGKDAPFTMEALADSHPVLLEALPTTTTTTTTIPPTTTVPPPPPTLPPTTTIAPVATTVPAVDHGSVWDRLAQCESGGNWHINTGNGYYGGLQFSLQTWRAIGGPGYPHEQSRETQIHYGQILQQRYGWGQWPACSRKLGLR